MKWRNARIAALCAVAAFVGTAGICTLNAQPAASVKRNIVLKEDMTIPGREAVMVLLEFPPGASEDRHIHPAAEVFAFVLEGAVTLENEGNPTATLKAGDSFHIAPGKIHRGSNNGTVTARVAAVFVAEKGKPLTTPVQ